MMLTEYLCSLKNSYVEIPNHNGIVLGGEAFVRWLGHEGITLTNEISYFIKETLESSLNSSAMWRHGEQTAIYEPGSSSSPYTKSASTLILNFPDFRTMRNKCSSFKPHSLQYFCYSSKIKTNEKLTS